MSMEHDQREFERYLAYQREQRLQRTETLGSAATMLFLATIDLGVSEVGDPANVTHTEHEHAEAPLVPELAPLRLARQRHLASFAASAAELGYARAA